MATPRLGITELVEGSAGNGTTANEALRLLEALLCAEITSDALATPPGSPTNGALYLVAASPTGAWTGQAGKLAYYLNGWRFFAPKGGQQFFVANKKAWYGYSSVESAWHPMQRLWSSTEHWTGEYRGSLKVYAKTVAFGAPPASGQKAVAHGITGLAFGEQVRVDLSMQSASYGAAFPQPQLGALINASFEAWVDTTNVNLFALGLDFSGIATVYARLEYCK